MEASNSTLNSTAPLNPMVFHPNFLHISEKILELLDKKSLKRCREVSKFWQRYIDGKNILWEKVLQDEDNAQELFFGACKAGHSKIARMLIRKSAHLNIDLNKKN